MRPEANAPQTPRVDEHGGGLAEIQDAESSPSNPAAGCDGNAVGEAAVGLDKNQQPFVIPWQVKVQQFAGVQTHAYTEYLPRTQARVHRANLLEQVLQPTKSHRAGASYACTVGLYGRNNQYGRRKPSGPGPGRAMASHSRYTCCALPVSTTMSP
jgi:hypothetical protein